MPRASRQHLAGRIAHEAAYQPPRRAVGRYDTDAPDALQPTGVERSILGHIIGDAWSPDAVEITLQHRWHAIPPRRVDQYDGVRLGQLPRVSFHRLVIRRRVAVNGAIVHVEDRVEALV